MQETRHNQARRSPASTLQAADDGAVAATAAPPAEAAASAALPPYARVKQHLKAGLQSGRWPPGAQLPSEAELVAEFGISRMTAGRALRELQAEGLVLRTQGLGSFAAPLHKVSATLTLHDLHDEIESRGHRHEAQVHERRAQRCSAALAEQLGVAPGSLVFHVVIVHFENGTPLQCEDRWVNPACAPNFLQHDFRQVTPTQVLFQSTALWRAQYSIEAGTATAREARLLRIAVDEPCLVIVRRTFTRDAVITLARLVHPGRQYSLHGEFTP